MIKSLAALLLAVQVSITVPRCGGETLITDNPLAAIVMILFAERQISLDDLKAENKKHELGLPVQGMEMLCREV